MRQPYEAVDVLPVNLIVDDRLFLIIGGGKVALRKARLLLAAGAHVRVVSPEMLGELRALAEAARLELVEREFRPRDVDGAFLVFAATDDHDVNIEVLEQARRVGALCCLVDNNWPTGDFLTPATFRRSGLIVSVSTGGKSCRRSRLIKENLAHHIDLVSNSELLVIGTSHEQLTVSEREPYHLTGERLERVGQMLSQVWGIHEFLLLNTCNRIELIAAVATKRDMIPLIERILGFEHLREGEYYERRGIEAFRHLALVTSGLLSQSAGEDHIVAQVKETLDVCEQHGWAGGIMRGLIGCVLHLSRDIREATRDSLEAGEIEDTCMHYLRAEGIEAAEAPAVVIGTGVVGRSVMQRLIEAGYNCTWCYHRNVPEAPGAWKAAVKLASLEDLQSVLRPARVVFTGVDSPRYILDVAHGEALSEDRGAVVFDLGIPRNVSPELEAAGDGLRVLDLDDLKDIQQREMIDVAAAIAQADEVIEEHREMYERIIDSLQDRHEE